MPRVKVGVTAHRRHKKILKLAKGYKGSKSKQFKKANETVMKALYYARRDRRAKKGNFRRLWIARINAAARTNGISYSRLVCGLTKAGVEINRKMRCNSPVTRLPYSLRRNGTSSPLSCACPNSRIYCSGDGFPFGKYLSQSAFSSGLDIALSQVSFIILRIVILTIQAGHFHSEAIVRNTLRTFR